MIDERWPSVSLMCSKHERTGRILLFTVSDFKLSVALSVDSSRRCARRAWTEEKANDAAGDVNFGARVPTGDGNNGKLDGEREEAMAH